MQLSIITISAFVALLNQGTKYLATNILQKDISKWIPVLSVIYGIFFGVLGYYVYGNMGADIIEAIFIGISAGSASTGVHQIYKQLSSTTTSGDAEKTTGDTGEEVIISSEKTEESTNSTDED